MSEVERVSMQQSGIQSMKHSYPQAESNYLNAIPQAQSNYMNTMPDAPTRHSNFDPLLINNMPPLAVEAKIHLLESENRELKAQLNERMGSVRSETNNLYMKRSEIIATPDRNEKYDRMACNLMVNKIKDALNLDQNEYVDDNLEREVHGILEEIEKNEEKIDDLQETCNTLRQEKIDLMNKLSNAPASNNSAPVQNNHVSPELAHLKKEVVFLKSEIDKYNKENNE